MYETHIFEQTKNLRKKYFTDLPILFFMDRYRKRTIFVRPHDDDDDDNNDNNDNNNNDNDNNNDDYINNNVLLVAS